jgi:hypothetical protein
MEFYWWLVILLIIIGIFGDKNDISSEGESNYSSSSSDSLSSNDSNAVWSSDGNNNCSHRWEYSHKGVDRNNIYKCIKCNRKEKRL